MKRKPDCLLREVAGEYLLVPTGLSAVGLNGMIVLSESAVFVWNLLETEQSFESLLAAVLAHYEVKESEAAEDLKQTLAELERLDLLEKAEGKGRPENKDKNSTGRSSRRLFRPKSF